MSELYRRGVVVEAVGVEPWSPDLAYAHVTASERHDRLVAEAQRRRLCRRCRP